MGSAGKSRRAEAERNREAIVTASARVLADDSRASIADIAAGAGVSKATMYGPFASRPELVQRVSATAMVDAEARRLGHRATAVGRYREGLVEVAADAHRTASLDQNASIRLLARQHDVVFGDAYAGSRPIHVIRVGADGASGAGPDPGAPVELVIGLVGRWPRSAMLVNQLSTPMTRRLLGTTHERRSLQMNRARACRRTATSTIAPPP